MTRCGKPLTRQQMEAELSCALHEVKQLTAELACARQQLRQARFLAHLAAERYIQLHDNMKQTRDDLPF